MAGAAVRFDAAADRLVRTASLPDFNAAYTICAWIYPVTLPGSGVYAHVFGINRNTTTNYDVLYIKGQASTQVVTNGIDNGSYTETVGATDLSVSTWYFVAYIRTAAASSQTYLGTLTAAAAAQASANTTNVAGRTAATRMEAGAQLTTNIDRFDGRIANITVWTRALSLAELVQEQTQYLPLSTTSLHLWTPLLASGSVNDYLDYSGNARGWTTAGTLTSEDGPPLEWSMGRRRLFLPVAAGGPTQYPLDVAGAITPTGALGKQAGKFVTGALTPAATVGKRAGSNPAGSLTPAGTVTRLKVALLSISGALTPAATLVKQAGKGLAGSLTPAASLGKRAGKGLAGSVTPAGALSALKVALLSLGGTLTPAGALGKRVGLPRSGALTPAGTVVKRAAKTMAGSLTPAGTLVRLKVALLSLGGTLAPAGTLVKRVGSSLAGAITPSGALSLSSTSTFVRELATAMASGRRLLWPSLAVRATTLLRTSGRLATRSSRSARATTRPATSGRAQADPTLSGSEQQ